MKYDCDKRLRRKCEKRLKEIGRKDGEEKRVFLWFPKRLSPHDCRWLEYVNRKTKLVYNIKYNHFLLAEDSFKEGDYRGCLAYLSRINVMLSMSYFRYTYTPISKEA